jgi:hypothetical protein
VPKTAIFAACKAIESIKLVDIPRNLRVKGGSLAPLQTIITSLVRQFPNVKRFSCAGEHVRPTQSYDLISLGSWKDLEKLILPAAANCFALHDVFSRLQQSPKVSLVWYSLSQLTRLVELDFPMLDPLVSNLKNLRKLTIFPPPVTLSLKTISSLSNLEYFQVLMRGPGNRSWSVCDFEALGSLPNLRHLDVPHMKFTDPNHQAQLEHVLERLGKLELVNFYSCKNLIRLPTGLFSASAATLSTVSLSDCSDLMDIDAVASLPLLRSLRLGSVSCTDAIVSSICRMSQLESLFIYNFVEGWSRLQTVAEALAPAGALRELTLESHRAPELADADLFLISSLTSLTKIHIHSRAVTAAGFVPLTALTNLTCISMYCPKLRKAQVEKIFPNIEVLH